MEDPRRRSGLERKIGGETVAIDFDRITDRKGTGSLKWDYVERKLGAQDVIPMWVADMDFPAPPAVVDALVKRAAHGVYGYPMISRTLREAAVGWLRARFGWSVERESLLAAHGVVPSLSLCVRALTRPGDAIVVQTPVYFPFYGAVELNGRRLVRNPLVFRDGRYGMDFDDLARKTGRETRMLILCSPHNPVGRVWTRSELEGLGALARERDLIVVSDEIHGEIHYRGHPHIPTASVSEDLARRTVTLLAPSKAFNIAGLSTSLIIAGEASLREKVRSELRSSGLETGNLFGLIALETAYTRSGPWLDELLAYLEGNVDFIEGFVAERLPALKFMRPEGTFLALLDCRGLGLAPEALHEFFWKRAGVYFSPGEIFGDELRGFERINFGCPRPLLREALERIERAAHALLETEKTR
jgi:cystathionine beta-lyase